MSLLSPEKLGPQGARPLPWPRRRRLFQPMYLSVPRRRGRTYGTTLKAEHGANHPPPTDEENDKRFLSPHPSSQLTEQAAARAVEEGIAQQDALVKELLHWFKHSFFHWARSPPRRKDQVRSSCPLPRAPTALILPLQTAQVDKPKCSGCGAETAHAGMGQPTHSDLAFGGNRVELYKCSACGGTTRFPRFNDAAKLLRTRRGRCGEWANCFTLCCRALGIEARWCDDH